MLRGYVMILVAAVSQSENLGGLSAAAKGHGALYGPSTCRRYLPGRQQGRQPGPTIFQQGSISWPCATTSHQTVFVLGVRSRLCADSLFLDLALLQDSHTHMYPHTN